MNRNNIRENKAGKEMELNQNQEKLKEYRKRAKELVAQMTLEEKVGQTLYQAPAIPRLGIKAYNWWNEALHGVARAGTATVFPQAIGMALHLMRIYWSRWEMLFPQRREQSLICSRKPMTQISIRD